MTNFSKVAPQIVLLLLIVIGVLAPFVFPVLYVLVLSIVLGFFVPPLSFFMGGLLDVLYFSGKGMPFYTIIGLCISISAALVQQFIKTRIMS